MLPHMAARSAYRPVEKTRLLTIQQASAEYGPPVSALRELVNRGHLPSVRLGDAERIWLRRDDIEGLIDRGVVVRGEGRPLDLDLTTRG
jgi:hypothetical protein